MTKRLQRATFNRSSLVRVLSGTLPESPDPKYDFGERIGQWLDFSDALTLFSVLNAKAGGGTSVRPADGDLPEQLARVRRNLSDAIANDGVFSRVPALDPSPTPQPGATAQSAADFSPYHRCYLAHQRDMSAAISALRADARKALASQSAAGRQLADLDAVFEKFLAARERNSLANIPLLLGKHFDLRHAEHRATHPDGWAEAGGGLEAFRHDARSVLLAELELRLKPVAALIAALETNETKPQ